MISAISYFYVNNTYDDFEIEMDKFVQEYYLNKKKTLKKEINTVLDILNYNVKKSNLNDENKTEIQLSEKKVSENKKSDKKIIKIKTIIKENKKVGNKLIKKLKIKLFEQEFDDEKTKKTLKKLQDISKLHFDFIKKLEELKNSFFIF